MLVLIVSDLHLPERASSIPLKFRELLVPGKIQHVLCAGNLSSKEALDFLRNLAGDVHVVRGESDRTEHNWPEEKVVTIGQLRIGLIHGHQINPWGSQKGLEAVQRSLDVDILIHGHTQKYKADEHNGVYYLNPGSLTGASTFSGDLSVPSFALLDINGSSCVIYSYTLGEEKVDVKRDEYRKKSFRTEVQ